MKVHIGSPLTSSFKNSTLKGFIGFPNQNDVTDDGSWGLRIEDVIYGTPINGTSLDDEYSDLAIIDSIFPGLLIPDRVWGKFNETIIKNITNSTNVSVFCNQT
jgi:hypothetical protein